jgi:hypothetical protein
MAKGIEIESFLMRPMLQKQSTLKHAGRIIPRSGGFDQQSLLCDIKPVIEIESIAYV